jgi:hypothetical protein
MMLTQLGILPGIKLDRVIIYNCLFIEW